MNASKPTYWADMKMFQQDQQSSSDRNTLGENVVTGVMNDIDGRGWVPQTCFVLNTLFMVKADNRWARQRGKTKTLKLDKVASMSGVMKKNVEELCH